MYVSLDYIIFITVGMHRYPLWWKFCAWFPYCFVHNSWGGVWCKTVHAFAGFILSPCVCVCAATHACIYMYMTCNHVCVYVRACNVHVPILMWLRSSHTHTLPPLRFSLYPSCLVCGVVHTAARSSSVRVPYFLWSLGATLSSSRHFGSACCVTRGNIVT